MKKYIAALFSCLVILLLIVFGAMVFFRLDNRPRTDDAFIDADIVHLAPDVAGRIVSLNVENNQSVHAGDILFVIDQQPYELKLNAARAQSRALETKIDDTLNEIASQVSRADAARTAIDNARAQLALAASTLARQEPLFTQGVIPAEQIDQSRTARNSAQFTLNQTIQQALSARQAVSSVRPLQAQLAASRASEALAQRDLDKTVVKAPFDGKVVGLNIAAGEYATTGQPVFTLINTTKWYAVANFRETEIARMSPGTAATVYLMAQPEQALQGRVESVGGGVLSDDAGSGNGMPRVAKTLDWVRLAQRFPVRILLDQPPHDAMRIGASAVVVIRYGDER
uniref:Multidrug resistance efflux pump n=1 Tax=Desulfovibrio sp. U5L TaxID=596152 RepID=I2PX59_9BACT